MTVTLAKPSDTMTLHAHMESSSVSCDGPFHVSTVNRPNDDEQMHNRRQGNINNFSDLMFKERVLGTVVSFHADATVSIRPDGFSYWEPTDEGHRNVDVTWCEDDCPDEYNQRDVYAEMMGY